MPQVFLAYVGVEAPGRKRFPSLFAANGNPKKKYLNYSPDKSGRNNHVIELIIIDTKVLAFSVILKQTTLPAPELLFLGFLLLLFIITFTIYIIFVYITAIVVIISILYYSVGI